MSTEKMLLTTVARADIILSAAVKWIVIALIFAAIQSSILLALWYWSGRELRETLQIDYDRPGVDITSEGPEDDPEWVRQRMIELEKEDGNYEGEKTTRYY